MTNKILVSTLLLLSLLCLATPAARASEVSGTLAAGSDSSGNDTAVINSSSGGSSGGRAAGSGGSGGGSGNVDLSRILNYLAVKTNPLAGLNFSALALASNQNNNVAIGETGSDASTVPELAQATPAPSPAVNQPSTVAPSNQLAAVALGGTGLNFWTWLLFGLILFIVLVGIIYLYGRPERKIQIERI